MLNVCHYFQVGIVNFSRFAVKESSIHICMIAYNSLIKLDTYFTAIALFFQKLFDFTQY